MIPDKPEPEDESSTGLPWPRSWRGAYWFVFGAFVAVVIALTIFTHLFA
jgi:hypothetical protein